MGNQAGVVMPYLNEHLIAIAKAEGWYGDAPIEKILRKGTSTSRQFRRSGSVYSSPRT